MEERIVELEVKVAFQENLLRDLDEVVTKMRDHVEELERQIREIRDQNDVGEEDPDQKPPHY